MTLESFWTILFKQWKLVVICFMIVGLGAYIGSKSLTPIYQSSTLVQVALSSTTNQSDINNLLASDQLVQTEATLVVSDKVMREVASHRKDVTAAQLASETTATAKTNTQLFEIDVQDSNPQRAAELANDIAATLIAQQLQVIQENNGQSQKNIQQDLDQTRQQIDTITSQLSVLQTKHGNPAQISVLEVQQSGLQQHYNQWETLLAQLELAQAQSGNFLRVAQPAQPATSPIRPSVLLNTAGGLLLGLLLGVLLAVLYEQVDTRVRTPEMLGQLAGWSVLGTIWRANAAQREALINPSGFDPNIESYRILRTNIGFASIDKPLRSLAVTSAQPSDGKSVIAANLAIAMARAGKQTLLIDADLRRPVQHLLFNLPADKMGLSNAVLAFSSTSMSKLQTQKEFQFQNPAFLPQNAATSGALPLSPFIHAVGISNLRVMPTGPLPSNPSELLDSKAMQRFLTEVANCGVEMVIFDTPPLLGLSDTSILASKVDGTLAVVDLTRASKGKLKQLKVGLAQTGANVLGCVANKHRRGRNDSAYAYYYQTEEQKGTEKPAGPVSPFPGTPLSPVSLSPFEETKKI